MHIQKTKDKRQRQKKTTKYPTMQCNDILNKEELNNHKVVVISSTVL
jgi:hypothetical protein